MLPEKSLQMERGVTVQHLTCSDLLDLKTARHEARAWRQHATTLGNHLIVRPVIDWAPEVIAATGDGDDDG
jgi:hypothetical protein